MTAEIIAIYAMASNILIKIIHINCTLTRTWLWSVLWWPEEKQIQCLLLFLLMFLEMEFLSFLHTHELFLSEQLCLPERFLNFKFLQLRDFGIFCWATIFYTVCCLTLSLLFPTSSLHVSSGANLLTSASQSLTWLKLSILVTS